MICDICANNINPVDLTIYDGEEMCNECAEELNNKDTLNDYYLEESLLHE